MASFSVTSKGLPLRCQQVDGSVDHDALLDRYTQNGVGI
jgi:hypothetical protein